MKKYMAGTATRWLKETVLPAGTYTLTLGGWDETEDPVTPLLLINTPDPTIGDLDITESVNITGAGSASTTIQWDTVGERDRIFHVFVSTVDAVAVNVAISGVKLTQGFTAQEDLGPSRVHHRLQRKGHSRFEDMTCARPPEVRYLRVFVHR